jgi:hypothetical protein
LEPFPLPRWNLKSHDEYDVQYSWDEGNSTYTAIAREGVNPIAALPDDDEQQWALAYEDALPVQKNADYKLGYAVEWAFDDDGKSIPVVVDLNATSLAALEATMDEIKVLLQCRWRGIGQQHWTWC